MSREGFSLAEVIAALLVLEVGILGTVGLVALATRLQREAAVLERHVVEIGAVADSLGREGFGGGGERESPWGTVRWEDSGGGEPVTVRLEARDRQGRPALELWTVVPSPSGEGSP